MGLLLLLGFTFCPLAAYFAYTYIIYTFRATAKNQYSKIHIDILFVRIRGMCHQSRGNYAMATIRKFSVYSRDMGAELHS